MNRCCSAARARRESGAQQETGKGATSGKAQTERDRPSEVNMYIDLYIFKHIYIVAIRDFHINLWPVPWVLDPKPGVPGPQALLYVARDALF